MYTNANAEIKTNINKPLFLGFLRYTGLICLNRVFARGQPTYEIVGRKKSIIDVCLVNHIGTVKTFKVLPQILG